MLALSRRYTADAHGWERRGTGTLRFFSSLLLALSACRPFREIFELMRGPLNLSLANCYFAHDSALLAFCDAPSGPTSERESLHHNVA